MALRAAAVGAGMELEPPVARQPQGGGDKQVAEKHKITALP
jgi:hypothetical protein